LGALGALYNRIGSRVSCFQVRVTLQRSPIYLGGQILLPYLYHSQLFLTKKPNAFERNVRYLGYDAITQVVKRNWVQNTMVPPPPRPRPLPILVAVTAVAGFAAYANIVFSRPAQPVASPRVLDKDLSVGVERSGGGI